MAYATVNGIRMHYTDEGTGTPVLFLHGWGTSGRAWDAQVADLGADHRVVTLDWRGCGRSDHPADGNTIAGNAADVLGLMDVIALDRALLVGNSMGAAFALEAALMSPERVTGVVSIDGPGYWPSQGMSDTLPLLRTALSTDRAAALADWVPQWFGPEADPDLARQTVRQVLQSGLFIDELFADLAVYDPRESLARLAVPAVFAHGRLDSQIPLEVSRTLAELAPYGEYHVIERAGHLPHQEQPAMVNALIRAVLARLAGLRQN
ncbi:putative 2-hydroxy-6-oxo-7-methylocta-2,4-dienoate hydrolase [Streptomyces sp. NBRC 110611]|uniref:alpha/beta fold hydrolase n=1 Tax=Streptomyces sp. NBRC 110611 TaxID=1621259 RepID=UPI00083294BA|nr:alpha/beta hydrolase [Streptomyces sp. NBRC 110611]GAU69297.1 putative 2-hydroxy-6-oxo-7-methylocta-2,4-dienoate hydrolase [Streptomyces sp. NBRC 110611]